MTERIVRETYTKEVKRRNFDEANRFIDQQIARGKYGISEVPVSREEKPRKPNPSDRTSRELQDMKKSIDNLQSLVIHEMERKRPNESRGSTPQPREKQYGSNWSLVAKRDMEINHLASELRDVKISLETLANALKEEKNKPVAPVEIPVKAPVLEIKTEVAPEPVVVVTPPKEQKEVSTCTEVEVEVPVMIPTRQEEEISKIKAAVEQLQKSVDDILTAKNNRKTLKDQQLLENPPVSRSEIAVLTQQLREQNEKMRELDEGNKSTTQLHDEVGAALFELKDNTDHSIRKLAEQVVDLVSANENMRMRIDLLDETLRELCQDDETSISSKSSKSSSSTLSTEPSRKKSKPDMEKLSYTKGHPTSDYAVRKNSSSSMVSSSSGSIAVELPPDSMTDGRRPSQAYVHSSATRMSIAAPAPLNPESSRFAEDTAAKALNDATRIRL